MISLASSSRVWKRSNPWWDAFLIWIVSLGVCVNVVYVVSCMCVCSMCDVVLSSLDVASLGWVYMNLQI